MTSALVVFQSIMNDEGKLIDARYIDMNPKNEEIIGYKKEDVLGKTILELFLRQNKFGFQILRLL